jgi:hypothetical protein
MRYFCCAQHGYDVCLHCAASFGDKTKDWMQLDCKDSDMNTLQKTIDEIKTTTSNLAVQKEDY